MGILTTLGLKKGSKDAAGGAKTGAASPKTGGGVAVSKTAAKRPQTPIKGKKKGGKATGPSGPLHERRRRLVSAREATMRDLGGLMLEMYKRNRFREELLLDKCEEVVAIEVEIAHLDQRLFQLTTPNAGGQRPIGRCECGAPIHPGQNFCAVCGRGFATLTQNRTCERCGNGLRPGDAFCSTCGTEAPDILDIIDTPVAAPSLSPSGGTVAATPHSTPAINVDPLQQATAPMPPAAQPVATQPTISTPPAVEPITPSNPQQGTPNFPTQPVATPTQQLPAQANDKDARREAREQVKTLAKAEKDRAKARKQLAKQRAKAAHEAKKRGGK